MSAQSTDSGAWAGPLAGIRVIDLSRVLAGPYLTQQLGDLGAEILKIEPPGRGDDTRGFAPHVAGESHYFMALNRNKKSLVIDLRTSEGADLLRQLVAKADILVENYRPGVMQRLGLGYEDLAQVNPRLIYCAVSGFGLSGPLRDRPSFDIVTQAMSGVLSVNGDKGGQPVKLGVPLGDMVGGVFGSIGVLAALEERHRTGRGRLVDISLHDGLMGMLGYLSQLYWVGGADPKPVGSAHPSLVPYGAFNAADGQIIIACLTEGFWAALCKALRREDLIDDARFATAAARLAHRAEVDALINGILHEHPVAYWVDRLTEFDVPNAPVLSVGQALSHPHTLAREMVVQTEHPRVGSMPMMGRPIKFPGATQSPLTPPPVLGQHTREVLTNVLGLEADTLDALAQRGVIDRTDTLAKRT